MATRYYSNTASATVLSASVTAAATTMTVDATTGWPVSYPFTLVIDPDTASEELVSVTNVAGTTLTVERGYDNTTGVAHSPGAVVQHVHSAADFADARDHEGSTNGVHGVTGAVVGVSDTQTLTNKDLSSATNTFPSSLATDAEVTAAVATGKAEAVSESRPVGEITMYGGAAAPTGWLECDGTAVSRATYADLFAVVGTSFGVGDGSTTFNVPNLTDRFPLGVGANALGATGGADEVTLTTAELPAHTHTGTTASSGSHNHTFARGDVEGAAANAAVQSNVDSTASGATSTDGAHTHTFTTDSTGTGGAFSVLNPFTAVRFIIRAA